MRQSLLFTKTRKDAPKDEVSKNAQLLIRAGFIHKEMSGVYSYLPLGLRVMNRIINIIREEMNAIGGQEISMTALQDKGNWEKTNRWDDNILDVWFKTQLKNGTELGLGSTHEEQVSPLMKDYIASYRDLPRYVYQFQTKFRNETRAKSGIMRCREFIMKDLYSFSLDQASHDEFYKKSQKAYMNIFKRVGLGDKTYMAFSNGGTFSKFSHEFQTVTDAGEDTIFLDEDKKIAINKEVMQDEILKELGIDRNKLVEKKAVEVGNIFNLGTKYSDPFELNYIDKDGNKKPVIMGCYGIGPGRVMGTVAEILSDKDGLVWPQNIAPFDCHLISLVSDNRDADKIYNELREKGIEILYDDRDVRAGEKFADSDLIGIPFRIVISEKTLKLNSVELKERSTGKIEMIEIPKLYERIQRKNL
jgi:prolyl-tRNA synthetase